MGGSWESKHLTFFQLNLQKTPIGIATMNILKNVARQVPKHGLYAMI
jgi:hypothetical protein